MKKLKQGQTVYRIDWGYYQNPPKPRIITMFLHSRKELLPLEGCIIDKWPVSHVNDMIELYGSKDIYFSRRKAQTALKAI